MKFSVDTDALVKAKETLNIKLPVIVRLRQTLKPGIAGDHQVILRNGEPKHLVRLNHLLAIEQANKTLWHELAHAQQHEEYVRQTGAFDFTAFYHNSAGDLGAEYHHNEWEIQARQIAHQYKDQLLLKES